MDATPYLRKLAKTSSWQLLYSHAREGSFPLFSDNVYSEIRLLFLYYLSFYYALNEAILLKETTKQVYEHELYEDAFMIYRSEKTKDSTATNTQSKKPVGVPTSQWIFKKK